MGIGTGQALLLRALAEAGAWSNIRTVCELGSQVPIAEELTDLFASFGKPPLEGKYSAKDLYEYLGATHYTSIDFNGLLNALAFDLNRNLHADYDYHESFDLVTNFGTSNVVFNQFEVFRNIHQLCYKGGYMFHTFPTQGWGHQWFFRYDTSFVEDLAAANDYQILFLEPFLRLRPYLRKKRADTIEQVLTLCAFIESKMEPTNSLKGDVQSVDLAAQRDLENRADVKRALTSVGKEDALFNITLACILKKKSENEFVTPILSMYQKYSG